MSLARIVDALLLRPLRRRWRQRWQDRFDRWLTGRIPRAPNCVLHQGNLFIFPTRQGLLFLLVVSLLLVGAINYQNSLLYFLSFLLGSLLVATILATFRNLSGLRLERVDAEPAQVGKTVRFRVRLRSPVGKSCYGVVLGWEREERQSVHVGDTSDDQDVGRTLVLSFRADDRGYVRPGRLLIESFYPLGLVRCWSYLDLALESWAYPAPIYSPLPAGQTLESARGALQIRRDGGEFYGLRDYQQGDAIRAIAWRRYASSAAPNGIVPVREFAEAQADDDTWFDLDQLPAGNLETRLRHLVGWIKQAGDRQLRFGLRLRRTRIDPDVGGEHQLLCLRAVGTYGKT